MFSVAVHLIGISSPAAVLWLEKMQKTKSSYCLSSIGLMEVQVNGTSVLSEDVRNVIGY